MAITCVLLGKELAQCSNCIAGPPAAAPASSFLGRRHSLNYNASVMSSSSWPTLAAPCVLRSHGRPRKYVEFMRIRAAADTAQQPDGGEPTIAPAALTASQQGAAGGASPAKAVVKKTTVSPRALTAQVEGAQARLGISRTERELYVPPGSLPDVSRDDFPSDFIFGAGCSAFQIEGSPLDGTRGHSVWDNFVHREGAILDGSVHYTGANFFENYEEDIKLAKEMGCQAFRFSISWTRIFPNGGQPGEPESLEGIQFYNRVINAIMKAGMLPFATLFHWETPQYLENDPDVLGFRTKNIVPYFVKLADTCFKHYGDRVKHWATFNEMWTYCVRGFAYGDHAPGRCTPNLAGNNLCYVGDSRTECYIVGHNLLLAHAKAYRLYNEKYKKEQRGVCGFNPCHFGALPYDDTMESKLAAERYLEFFSGWQIDPVVFGDYPRSMREALGDRLPTFTKEESEELKNSLDFLGHNYYSAYFVQKTEVPEDFDERWYENDAGTLTSYVNADGKQIGAQMGPEGSWILNCGHALPSLIEWCEKRYGRIPSYITENGTMDKEPNNAEAALQDSERVQYVKDHLAYIKKAISENGANVKGYFYWSFIDVFEWETGHESRFGLYRTEFDVTPSIRTPKASAKWYTSFLNGSK